MSVACTSGVQFERNWQLCVYGKETNLRLQFLYCAGAAFEHIHKLLYRRGALALRWSAAVQRSPLGTVLRPSL
ncbi:hypothetical protein ACLKA6_008707 [Drosophila palustris]